MKPEFKQSVAMKVTRQQFERDLKEPLEKLGYEDRKGWNRWTNPESGAVFLHTTECGLYAWYNHTSAAYHIEDYDPELFLALAAMTKGDVPIVGEWVKSEDFNIGTYSFSKVVKVEKDFGVIHLEEYVGNVTVGYSRGYDEIKRLTLEELVEHLGKKEQHTQDGFVLPEKWKIKLNDENRDILIDWVKSRPDYDEAFNDFQDTSYIVSKHWLDNSYQVYSSSVPALEDYTEITIEQFKKHVLNMEFTKDDLKTGMVMEFDDGERGLVFKDTSRGDIVAGCGTTKYNAWFPFDCLNNDLTRDKLVTKRIVTKVYDVPSANMNVGSLDVLGKLIWKRKEEPKEYIITPEQAKSIIDIACNDWKDKLFDLWGKQIIFKRDITVSYPFYKQMRRACTHEQHKLFNKIFK